MTSYGSSFSNLVTPEFTNSGDQNVTLSGHVVGSGPGRSVSLYRENSDGTTTWVAGTTCDSNGDFSFTINVQSITNYHFYSGAKTVGADTYAAAVSASFTVKSLRFYDGFDYADAAAMFASGRWATRQPGYGPAGGNRTLANNSDQAVEVSGGQLKLKVLPDPDQANHPNGVLVGMITAGTLPNFVGGHIEARIKHQRFKGAHGGVWHQGGYGPGQAEWDIVEFFGERGSRPTNPSDPIVTQFAKSTVYTTTAPSEEALYAWTSEVPNGVFGDNDPQHTANVFAVDYGIWGGFHTYHGYWGSTTYKFLIDDKPCGTIKAAEIAGGVATQPGELILSFLCSDGDAANPATTGEHGSLKQLIDGGFATYDDYVMTVDWVRVWK